MNIKEKISNEAISWINTPFHHQGRKKKVGVDCIGLIVGIAKNLQLKSHQLDKTNKREILLHELDKPNYSRLPNKSQLKETLENLLTEISQDQLDIGDVILFKMDKWPQHVGIISSKKQDVLFIHASEPVGKVILSRFDSNWQRKAIGFYRFCELKKDSPEHGVCNVLMR